MAFQDLTIKRKVMGVIMLTSTIVLTLTAAAFMVYDLVGYRRNLEESLVTSARITANASPAAVVFEDEQVAQEALNGLQAEPRVVAAALYDLKGKLFVRYPTNLEQSAFPLRPGKPDKPHFENGYIHLVEPVSQEGAPVGY